MKFLRFLIFAIIAGCMFSSCQKEFSSEAGNAHGSLKSDAGGDCLPIMIGGSFKKDSVLKTSNYADIQVNITQTGTYYIKTDTVNGYSFSGAGAVAVTGTNTIRLLASGKPITQGVDVFTVKFDTTECEFNVTVTGTSGGAVAVFTLAGSPTACTGATQTTNFYAAIPTNPSNTVTVNANVTTAGTYTITASPTTANGLTFTGSGTLAIGSNQPIVLVADGGAPSAAGTIPYTLTSTSTTPATNCGFDLTVQATPPPASFTFDCTAPAYTGTYEANTPTTGGTVVISVTSTAGGAYTITSAGTGSDNGVSFMGSGVLPASPTPQQVTLYASGTPTVAGTFTYTLTSTGATGSCTIDRTYTAAPPTSTDFITATVNGVATTFNFDIDGTLDNSVPGYTVLNFFGYNTASGNEAMDITVAKSGTSLTPGIYTTNQIPGSIVTADYTDAGGTDYMAQPDGITPPTFTVQINTIDATRVTGIFSGTVKDTGGNIKTISNGSFSVSF